MSTVKPANFVRIDTGVTPAGQTGKGDKLRQLQKEEGATRATVAADTVQKPIENATPTEVTLHASQARILKLYEPKLVAIKQPAKLGQIIDIKI